MRLSAALACALLVSGCVTVPAADIAPPVLLDFYKDADAYQASAGNRLCADPALAPPVEALQSRLAAARQALIDRYGAEQVEAARVAVVSNSNSLCSDKAAAATAVANFEKTVSDLEAALR